MQNSLEIFWKYILNFINLNTLFETEKFTLEKSYSLIDFWLVYQSLHKKWSFLIRISSVNMAKSTVSGGFGHINWRNALWKTSFFVQ